MSNENDRSGILVNSFLDMVVAMNKAREEQKKLDEVDLKFTRKEMRKA